MKKFIGKSRIKNLEWLLNTWLREGPPVCFLQGFSGVGKTDLARDFRKLAEQQQSTDLKPKWQQAVINEIADRATPSVLESLMELSLTLSQQGLPEMEQALFDQESQNTAFALEKALQRPVVIIIDEAQRFFCSGTGAPLPDMNKILSHLRNRPDLPGRLLLLSDRIVEEARWSEWIPKRTLTKLEPEEAIEALSARLSEAEVVVDIPTKRKREVVRDLDFNPRAIEALVGALRHETLDEIIESNPGLWAVRDREVSREFLNALERDLLERTLRHLDEAYKRKLWKLAVHRRSFKCEALEKLCGSKEEATELRITLVSRYLINFYMSALSLNPIVREIALAHLRESAADFKQAHSSAADYHLRHFKAKQIVGSQTKLGESFAELRYHLVQAGREDELGNIEKRFTNHLKQEIHTTSPVPNDHEELDERIGVLTVLLGHGGAAGLEYHLARCLQRRGRPDDIEQAIVHGKRALNIASVDPWILQAKLLAQSGKINDAVTMLKEGIKLIPAEKNLVELYQSCAELMTKSGKINDAVTLLKKGIKVIPADKNLFSLYQICAELMTKSGKINDAVTLLKDGIKLIPADKGLSLLYQSCAELVTKSGKIDDAVALLKDGIKVIPVDKGLSLLYQSCAKLLGQSDKIDDAVTLIKDGIKVIPADKGLSSLYQIQSKMYCQAGNVDEAIASLRKGADQCSAHQTGHKLSEDAIYLCAAANATQTLAEILSEAGASPQAALGAVVQYQTRGDWHAAADTASAARREFPYYFPLAVMEAFSHLSTGDAEAALRALTDFPGFTPEPNRSSSWLVTFAHLRRGACAEAATALETYLGRPVDESRELNETFLLRLWDQQETAPGSDSLCFCFPIMPSSLTGLGNTVRRVPYSKPVLPPPDANIEIVTATAPGAPVSPTTEVYVSYSWGEDTSEAGIQREEIVDRLCDKVAAATGRPIGRDKERMRGGDSIDRFAHEISKANRIIAIISEKSLHSEFCMAQELFRAFRRCDYQREEFQEKVIALVMDDAKPSLRDNSAIITLANEWKQRLEKLRTELHGLDPNRKSPNLWVFVDMIEEMCPRLPDMLGALADIVMKRGFEEITADNFKQVIDRLS